jgi:hypothetical protein
LWLFLALTLRLTLAMFSPHAGVPASCRRRAAERGAESREGRCLAVSG